LTSVSLRQTGPLDAAGGEKLKTENSMSKIIKFPSASKSTRGTKEEIKTAARERETEVAEAAWRLRFHFATLRLYITADTVLKVIANTRHTRGPWEAASREALLAYLDPLAPAIEAAVAKAAGYKTWAAFKAAQLSGRPLRKH
jgi:hypothetical protein